ncbi:UvrD-helicase domain-containing protein [Natroniella sp. ANB-PHB2]|uniref:UvrD-helicase domain-containing protein n=1 Tax=Natroniella sp. ANB-PHB2 TaxID=3384444 RepID=UPI0038D47E72
MINILKASAGTGKTYRLSLDYVAALLQGEDFTEIVVMTFTRKATAEIRERIFEHLENILDKGVESEVFKSLQEVYSDIELELDKLEEIYREMICNKEKVKVYTIDSFINNIFSQAIAPYLDIYSYEIVDDEQNREILEKVFKELLTNPADFELLEKFLTENVERNVDNYIELIKQLLKDRWKFLLIKRKERAKREVGNLVAEFEQTVDALESIALEKGKEFSKTYFKKAFRSYLKLEGLADKKDYITKNYKQFIKDTFWNGNKTRGKKVAALKEDLEASYDQFREMLANYIYNQEMLPYEEEVFNFSQRIFEIYDQIKFQEKIFTHTDISNYTYRYFYQEELNLITGEGVSDYFFELLGSKVTTLLIDEFQDTSILQWRILQPLLAECQNIVAVGDQKQSIYGWRGGEKELFANLEEILGGDSESLSTSYRSEREIIEFINRFFSGIYEGWEYEGVEYLSEKDGGYVEVLYGGQKAQINTDTNVFAKLNEEHQRKILNLNQQITEEIKVELAKTIKEKLPNYNEIGILARSNDDLVEIAAQLEREGIPYILESKDSLVEHRAIKPLYFLLRYLTDGDYLSLIKFLASELIGLNNGALKYLLRNKSKIEDYLSGEAVELEAGVLTEVLTIIRDLKELEFNSLANQIVEELGLLVLYQDNSSALKNIYYFFAEMKKFESLPQFIAYIEENKESEDLKQVGIQKADAVQLMTIHKSKGLSFETEFFYWKPKSNRGSRGNKLELYLDFDQQFENVEDYLLTNSKYSILFEYLGFNFQKQKEEKSFVEEINNVYVALTRPVRNLFLYIEAPCSYKRSLDTKEWSKKGYEIYEEAILKATKLTSLKELVERKSFGKLMVDANKQSDRDVELPKLQDYFQTVVFSKDEMDKDLELSIDREIKKIKGLAIHYYLEYIRYDTSQEREYARSMVLAKYGNLLGPTRLQEVFTRAEDLIDRRQDYFSNRWDIYTEYQLVSGGKEYRIDRLMVDNKRKEVVIVDYKSGWRQKEDQLAKYAKIVGERLELDYEIKTEFVKV